MSSFLFLFFVCIYYCLFFLSAGKPKLSDLISLKLNDWFKVGEKIGIDRQSLRHIKKRYKDNRHECQKGMFAKWMRSEEPQTYEPLLQALINSGETRAAEELHQKFG